MLVVLDAAPRQLATAAGSGPMCTLLLSAEEGSAKHRHPCGSA